ncbi:DUF2332 domain-containing protein [Nocardioides pakistanensis]
MELYGDLAGQYRDFAAYAAGDSPCFEAWALGVAGDPEVLAWIGDLPPVKQQPNLVFAAARWHGVPAPGPYDGLRTALLADDAAIRSTILARSTQTNEVGRLATLVPVFSMIEQQAGRPLALIEVGASAGLCLYPDRYGYAWTSGSGAVLTSTPGSPRVACEVTGPAPLPHRPPQVAWRGGLDLNPLDVTDDDAMAWLANLVWPEQDDRRRRLEAAVAVARAEPPVLRQGDLLTDLPTLLEEAAGQGEVVVFHSAVIAYLEPADRERFHLMMTGLVADGVCRWVSNEAPAVLPAVADTAGSPAPAGRFTLGLDGRAVAWTHGHGRSMTWL